VVGRVETRCLCSPALQPHGMGFYYDPSVGPLSTATTIASTVVPHVLRRREFWLFFTLHISIYTAYNLGYLTSANDKTQHTYIEWNNVKVITALTSFFEVFYTNQCWTRYVHLYRESRQLLTNLHDLVFELRLYLSKVDSYGQSVCWLSARYAVLAVELYFLEMRRLGEDREWAWLSDKDWQELISKKLVYPEERSYLATLNKEQRRSVLLSKSAEVAKRGVEKSRLPNNVLKSVVSTLEMIREEMQEVADTVDLPIPFQYFHILNMMVCMNTVVWAYAMGITHSIFGPVVYYFAALIFLGMLELGSQLSNPFGQDEVDFPVAAWLKEFVEVTGMLMDYQYPGATDDWKFALKEELEKKKKKGAPGGMAK